MKKTAIALTIAMQSSIAIAFTFPPNPSQFDDCTRITAPDKRIQTHICYVDGNLVPPSSAAIGMLPDNGRQPIAFSIDTGCTEPVTLELYMPGSNPTPTNNTAPDTSNGTCKALINVGPGHWPNAALWGNGALDQGVHFYSDNYWRRTKWALTKALLAYGNLLDLEKGGTAFCLSIGANTCMAMLMNMEEGEAPNVIGYMKSFFMVNGITVPEKVLEGRPLAAPQLSGYSVSNLNFAARAQTGVLDNKYLRIDCSSDDFERAPPSCDPEISDLANEHGVHLVMTRTPKDHNIDCSGINLPCTEHYPHGEEDAYRHNTVHAVIVNSSANRSGAVAHHNLGLYYAHAVKIPLYNTEVKLAQDRPDVLILPFSYSPWQDIGHGADQPDHATFDAIIRNPQSFPLTLHETYTVTWYESSSSYLQQDIVVSKPNEIRINALPITKDQIRLLVIKKK